MAGTGKLSRVCGLKAIDEPQMRPRNRALDHRGHRLCTGVRALRRTLWTDLVVAGEVAVGDVGSTLCLTHRTILQDQVSEKPRLAVVSIGTQPLLPNCTNICGRQSHYSAQYTWSDVPGARAPPRERLGLLWENNQKSRRTRCSTKEGRRSEAPPTRHCPRRRHCSVHRGKFV